MAGSPIDPIALARALIQRASGTPVDAGAMDIVQSALAALGFVCRRMRSGEIENLYARWGTARPNLCFAGHTDVVPVGDEAAWTHAPFAATVESGVLIGRGAADFREMQQAELLAARMRSLVVARVRIADSEAYEAYARDHATASLRARLV